MKMRFDYSDGDYCFDMGGGMMMDNEGNLMQDMGGGMAMDLDSGELHIMEFDADSDEQYCVWHKKYENILKGISLSGKEYKAVEHIQGSTALLLDDAICVSYFAVTGVNVGFDMLTGGASVLGLMPWKHGCGCMLSTYEAK